MVRLLQAKRHRGNRKLGWPTAGQNYEGPQVGSNSISFGGHVRGLYGPGQKGGLQRPCERG